MESLSLSDRFKTRANLLILKVGTRVLPIPTPRLLLGPDSAVQLCDAIAHHGAKHVLIVTDQTLVKLGMLERLTAKLDEQGVRHTIFAEILPDPTFSMVHAGLKVLKQHQCDSVMAVGGGSVIDAAKVMALAATNGGKPEKLIGLLRGFKRPLPLFAVPTTAGTGSEATIAAVISDDKTHQKGVVIDHKVVPVIAALDPVLMQGMPPSVTADTGIDALTHSLESWISLFATERTDDYAAASVQMIFKYLPIAFKDGKNLEARSAMALASHYGGLALNNASLGYVHAIAHQLGAYYKVPHGRANAIALPYVMEASRKSAEKRMAELARRIGLVDADMPDTEASHALIARIKQLTDEVKINRHVAGMNRDDFKPMIEAALKEAHGTYPVPYYFSKVQMYTILGSIMLEPAADAKAA